MLKSLKQQGIDINELDLMEPEQPLEDPEKQPKVNTYAVTKSMIEDGLSPEQIAKERHLKISTIYGHISRFIEQDEYDAQQFLSEEHYQTIRDYFESTGDPTIGIAKDVLGDDYDYGEIRMVEAELQRDGFFNQTEDLPL